jgi:iron complex outermembrane recepter protein
VKKQIAKKSVCNETDSSAIHQQSILIEQFKRKGNAVLRVAIATLLGGAMIGDPAFADDATQQYKIPAQSLNNALMKFAADSNLELIFSTDTVRSLNAKSLDGTMTPEQALGQLLQGSGYTYRFIDKHTVTLDKAPQSKADTPTLKAMTVTGTAVKDVNDPYNTDYNRTNASTATKTDTPIMETPIAIQVVPRAVIQDQQSIQVGDAVKNVSGVFSGQTFGGFAEQFMIRGFNTAFSNYYDGFRFPASRLSLANIERVEVVKGAAANLYGRIEPGGMINMVTKRPQATPYYALEQQFGSYDLYRTTADATGAINKDGSLMYRLNFESLNKNSFRDFAFTDRVFVAPSLTWKISDRTQLDLDFMYSDEDTQEDYGVVASTVTHRPINIPISRYLGEPSTDKSNTKLYNTGVTLSHAFTGDWKVKAKFNYLKRDVVDPSTGPGSFNDLTGMLSRSFYEGSTNDDVYNGTVDVTGKFSTWGLKHKVLVGWDYYNITTEGKTRSYAANSINVYNPVYSPVDMSQPVNGYFNQPIDWNGVYFQDQITIFDKLHILGGGRYDWISSSFGSNPTSAAGAVTAANTNELNNQRFSPKVGLVYQPWEWLSLYGNYVESVGNLNGAVGRDGKVLPPQTGEQYEVGFKNAFFDNRLTSSVAFYQLTKLNLAVPIIGTLYSEAIGKSRSQGVEIDVSGRVTDGLSLIASYAYTEASILKAASNQGNQLWNVPRNAGSLWAKYDFQQEAVRGLSVGAGAYFQGQKQGNNANTYQLPGWGRLDALVKYKLPEAKAKTTLQFNIENLLDHQYYAASNGGNTFINPGQPRTFMGSVKVEF